MSSYAYVYVWDITTFRENNKYIYVHPVEKKDYQLVLNSIWHFSIAYTQEFISYWIKKEHKMSISKIIKTDCMHSSRFLTLNKHASCVQTSPSTVAMGKGKAMTLNQLEQGHETTLCKILVWSLHVFFSSNGTDRLKLHLLSAYG